MNIPPAHITKNSKSTLKAEEEAAIAVVLEGQQCIKEGNIIEGNLRDLIKSA